MILIVVLVTNIYRGEYTDNDIKNGAQTGQYIKSNSGKNQPSGHIYVMQPACLNCQAGNNETKKSHCHKNPQQDAAGLAKHCGKYSADNQHGEYQKEASQGEILKFGARSSAIEAGVFLNKADTHSLHKSSAF
jgi:hypothetical protein